MSQPDLTFLSLEFDKLVAPARFATSRLFNIHFSLLPRLRGCNTSIWPILNRDTHHGVTLHWIDAGMDTGPIIDQRSFAIEGMTARQIYFRSMDEGRDLVLEWLGRLISGAPPARVQDESLASSYRRADLDFGLAQIHPAMTVEQALTYIRAFTFPEYQLPTYEGHGIVAAGRIDKPAPPGHLTVHSAFEVTLGMSDGALRLSLDKAWSGPATPS